MSHDLPDPDGQDERESDDERSVVRRELDELRRLLEDLSLEQLRNGNWFAQLLTHALRVYSTEVDTDYLRQKYKGLPSDAIVAARIELAARYAAIEGGLSAAAYTGVVAATIGSGGAASPLTLPAAGASFAVDLAYTTQLQLRLAWDIAILYRVPIDLNDSEDLWKLIRVAFVIRTGELGRTAIGKGAPAVIRPLVKKIFSGSTLTAARSLPVVGKYLLQRNIIKFSLPAVGIPLSIAINHWSTRIAGAHARKIFRLDGRIIEAAHRMSQEASRPDALLWVLWMVAKADALVHENERALLRHVAAKIDDLGTEAAVLAELELTVEVDRRRVWSLLEDISGDKTSLYEAAVVAAVVDGKANPNELRLLEELAARCGTTFDENAVRALAKDWSTDI